MKESTKAKYRKDARSLIDRYFKPGTVTENRLIELIHDLGASGNYTAKSFSNLKRYVALFVQEHGYPDIAEEIKAITPLQIKDKPGKIKTISNHDIDKILAAVNEKCEKSTHQSLKKNTQFKASVIVLHHLGCRPGELLNIKRVGRTSFFIEGIKKDENGERGLDRIIDVGSQQIADEVDQHLQEITDIKTSQVRDNFRYLLKTLFPRRKKLPTLYIFRHLLGSQLKASQLDRKEMAYILGHQSTRTLESYGYKQAGKAGGLNIKPAVPLDEIELLVRDNHTKRAERRLKRLDCNYQENLFLQ